jgi:hypothetical protein
VRARACVCVCMCVCVYMYIYVYIYTYIHTHTHTHIPLLLLRWHYSPMRTFAPLMDFSHSALILTSLSTFQFCIINICLYIVPPSDLLVVLLFDFPEDYC